MHAWVSDAAPLLSSCGGGGGARPKGASELGPNAGDRCVEPSSDASVMGVMRPLLAAGDDPPGGVPATQHAAARDPSCAKGSVCEHALGAAVTGFKRPCTRMIRRHTGLHCFLIESRQHWRAHSQLLHPHPGQLPWRTCLK